MSNKRITKGLILGGILAGMFWITKGPPGKDRELPQILISAADVAHQRARWEKMRGRPPTERELKNAMDAYVRNEILYSEALAKGMDREDPRVRLALIQKMQMLMAGQADAQGISEQELESFYALRKERYKKPATLSVTQVLFKEGNTAPERAQQLLAQFEKKDPSDLILQNSGDVSMLETRVSAVSAQDLEQQFGSDFTAEVLSLPSDQWSGPIRSGFGWHIVKVFDRIPGRIPELAAIREKVENDVLYETRKAFEEQGFQEIESRYHVVMNAGAEQLLSGEKK